MWVKVYEKKSSISGDDIENMLDYKVKYISSYKIAEFEIEEKESGIFHVNLECGGNGEGGKPESYIYAQADTETSILEKANALAKALDSASY
jgi:hypothetical protein